MTLKITTADCVEAIKRSPFFATVGVRSAKRRSKRKVGSQVVRVFEVTTQLPTEPNTWAAGITVVTPEYKEGSTRTLYVRVVEEDSKIAVYPTDAVTAAREEAAPDEEQIDAERFQQMLKKEEPESEDDIDVARFRGIG